MKTRSILYGVILILLVGCAAPIKLTETSADDPGRYNALIVYPLSNDVVGEVNEEICTKVMIDAAHGIVKKELFPYLHVAPEINVIGDSRSERVRAASLPYDSIDSKSFTAVELHTTLIDYKKGSSTLRFFFGIFAGGGHVTMEMRLIDHRDRHLIMAGTTEAKIQGAYASEKDVVGPLSKAITKFVGSEFRKHS